ncbi:type II toxin-antitoxin system HipA family toxin [Thalassospira sp.]|uniref:type II toxin-antitoxin system HipA family toxin n=1 Tax=Thalassospira sp. TaxID=1912094 RepID=UPI002735BF6D|nr:type II toxin-antitoxin system HipA family toxin [Thalassospira sp.]MDP2697519.1 type II toxin-antitoxin system HipA family toxin [Thalassospira sp.]
MKKSSRHRPLTVLLNGRLVGAIRMASSGAISFQYDQGWLDREYALPVSRSLPLGEQAYRGAAVIAWLENLLPDNQVIRERVAAKVGATGTGAYHLLEKIGRDCVGALQFVVDYDGENPTSEITGDILSERQIADILKNLATVPLGIERDHDFRISLAGAQEKTALLHYDGAWIKPSGMTPTTHILKTQIGTMPGGIDLQDSVENEFFCMRFCKAMGADIADVEIHDFEDCRALVIKRFDRQWMQSGKLLRLPQEDFCQATGYPPSRKYQSDGGPGIVTCVDLLSGSDRPTEDQIAFFRAQILFWMLAATDGHAKNFSLFLQPGGGFVMTPLYDILSVQKVCDDGQVRHRQVRLAMSVGDANHSRVDEIAPRHFVQSARAAGFGVGLVAELMADMQDRIPQAIEETYQTLPDDFPPELAASITRGIEARGRVLQMGIEHIGDV